MSGVLNLLLAGAASAIKDAYFNLTTLLLNTSSTNGAQNNTFLDSSSNNFTITRNGNTTQGTFTPFSQTGWSNYLDGSSYLSSTTAGVGGSGDFTVEAWVYPTITSSIDNPIYDTRGGTGWNIFIPAGLLTLNSYDTSAGVLLGASTNSLTLNAWNHVAFVKSGSNNTYYINGVSSGTYTRASTATPSAIKIGSDTGSGKFRGYISNFRTVTSAVYTSAFTPPTAPLTAISGTQLLTCQSNRFADSSTNALTLTVNGTPSVQAFSPFLPTAAYDTAVVGGSGYFDGSGDYLSLASNANLTPASSTYTFECWVYRTASGAMTIWDTSVTNGFYVHINGSNKVVLRAYGTADIITSSLSAPVNSWFHVAVARGSANSTKMWINGSSSDGGSATDSTTYAAATTYIGIYDGSTVPLTGYISGMRLVKGSDVYGVSNSTITVPTAPPTAITNTQFLANYTNAGIYDSASKNVLETVGNAQVSTTQAKWGTTSMAFDGTGDWLYQPYSVLFPFGTGDFTIEWWMNPDASQNNLSGIFNFQSGTTYFIAHNNITSYPNLITVFVDGYGAGTRVLTGATTLSSGTWYHVAITRASGTWRLFVNGTLEGSTYSNSADPVPSNATFYIGQGNATGYKGYIDDFRITKYARYTANFTPPTAAFPLQ